jgi:2-dehydropantoate 2-reductase
VRIAIYGAGGLGGYYGARLAEAGHEVGFIARGAQLAAMRERGLQILSPLGDYHLAQPLASDQPADIGPVDLVLLAVKTWQVPQVAIDMQPLIGSDTAVVPFLNGVEAADQCVEVLGSEPVLGGLSRVFSQIESPGVIRHMNPHATIELGELSGQPSERSQALAQMFSDTGIDATVSDDIRTALWQKLMLVASWSGIATASRTPLGPLLAEPGSRALIEQSMDECFAVGRARGYQLPDSLKQTMWQFYEGLPADTSASMMRDILDGKPSELAAWIGAIVRFGQQTGVPTPVASVVYQLLLPMEQRARADA